MISILDSVSRAGPEGMKKRAILDLDSNPPDSKAEKRQRQSHLMRRKIRCSRMFSL